MRKLTLDLDALRVESWATGDTGEHRGTVRAHDDETVVTEMCTQEAGCTKTTCPTYYGQNTCDPVC